MKKRFSHLITATLFTIASCSKLEDIDTVTQQDILKVNALRYTLSSGSKDETTIVARIPKDAGILDVSFTATAGVFPESATKTIKQLADSLDENYRYSSVVLQSDTSHGNVYITVEVSTQRQRVLLNFK